MYRKIPVKGSSKFAVIVFLCWASSVLLATSIPLDWKSYIHPDILHQFLGKEWKDRFSTDYFEGDIAGIDLDLDEEDLGFAKNAVTDAALRWVKGVVPYTTSSLFTPDQHEMIKRALAAMSSLTHNCITFVQRKKEQDYLKIIRGFGCHSQIGRQGGKQTVQLSRGCMESPGDIQHEMMHALGFHHEMSRSDRDDFVWINWVNIQKENHVQFQKYMNGTTFGLPYDYESVLHYSPMAFAIDTLLPTVVPRRKNTRIGQNKNLSPLDVAKIHMAYKCEIPDAQPAGEREEENEDEDATTAKPITRTTTSTTTTTKRTTTTTTEAPEPITEKRVFRKRLEAGLPVFRQKRISYFECKSLDTGNCFVSSISNNCQWSGLYVGCFDNSTNRDLIRTLEKIADLNADQPIDIRLYGSLSLTSDMFEPVRNSIVQIWICDNPFFTTSDLRYIHLPNLLGLYVTRSNNVKFFKGDLDHFTKLRLIHLNRSPVSLIEDGAFSGLTLNHLSVDGWECGCPLNEAEKTSLRLLHCDCSYAWLRQFLYKYPFLLHEISDGQVYNLNGFGSFAWGVNGTNFRSVDCNTLTLTTSKAPSDFSVNEKCGAPIRRTESMSNSEIIQAAEKILERLERIQGRRG